MSDFSLDFQPLPGFSINSSSSGISGIPTTPNSSSAGFTAQSNGGGVTGIFDSLTGSATNIFHSFTNGISSVINGVAQNYGNYLNGSGTVVGYDRYNQPIYQVRDPVTGALSTTATPALPGSSSSPSNSLERTPPSYQTGGVWGWLTNMLSLPAVQPQLSIGTTPPATTQQSFFTSPIIGGFSVAQIGMGIIGGYLAYTLVKKVV